MERFEIYSASQVFKGCSDDRPWIIVDLRPNGVYGCFPIAGEDYGDPSFFIDAQDPDFAATGLTKSCHILDKSIFELKAEQFKRYRGRLENKLLAEFREYSGL
jgi:hypothetical protein